MQIKIPCGATEALMALEAAIDCLELEIVNEYDEAQQARLENAIETLYKIDGAIRGGAGNALSD